MMAAVTDTYRLLAVASGKGGVGKTWLSITLAHVLARTGRRVLLFDGDLGLANIDVQLGLVPRCDLGEVVAGRARVSDAVTAFPEGGFDVVAGRSGSGAMASLDMLAVERLLSGLRSVAERYDIVLLDLGAGVDRPLRRMASAADTLLVVATEEPTSLTDAYAVIKLQSTDLRGVEADRRIIVNQAGSRSGGEQTYATLARACSQFLGAAPPLAGVVRRDDRVREAIRHQSLLLTRHPLSDAARDVERLAEGCLARQAVAAAG